MSFLLKKSPTKPKDPVSPPKAEPPTFTPTTTENPNWDYIAANIKLDPEISKQEAVKRVCEKIIANRQRYFSVEKKTGVPAKLVAAIHYMESSLSFKAMLHNGEPLNIVSRITPKGVGPFESWEDSAIDALKAKSPERVTNWTLGAMLAFAEKYNGKGYRKRGVYSSYVCSHTNYSEELGKYVADGVWDGAAKHTRPGVASIILMLNKMEAESGIVTPPEQPDTPEQISSSTPWMNIAIKENGVSEIAGSNDNKRIVEYHQATTLKATDDETPWCASFVSWVFLKAGLKSRRSARAKDWLEWGVSLSKPKYGCVVVFTRQSGGHVAFFVKEDSNGIYCLGGNQGNKVCYAYYKKENLLGYRWPSDF